jgi:hypothetical protein
LCSMLDTLSPARSNLEETLSTIQYANRAKMIQVAATKNEEMTQIDSLNDEISGQKLDTVLSNTIVVKAQDFGWWLVGGGWCFNMFFLIFPVLFPPPTLFLFKQSFKKKIGGSSEWWW